MKYVEKKSPCSTYPTLLIIPDVVLPINDSTGTRDTAFQKSYSKETAKIIDEEVRKLVKNAYEQTKNILTENKAVLIKTAELLLQKETIFKEDIEMIVRKPIADKDTPAEEEKNLLSGKEAAAFV